MRIVVALLALLCGLRAASAQTAEETVAYLLLGLEDGVVSSLGRGRMTFGQTGTSPATYIGKPADGRQPVEIRATVTRKDDCVFDAEGAVVIDGKTDTDQGVSFTVDFGKVTGIESGRGGEARWTGTGLCRFQRGGSCDPDDRPRPLAAASPARLAKAYEYLRANFCKGRAF